MLNQFHLQFMQRANQAIAMIALKEDLQIHEYSVSRESIKISFWSDCHFAISTLEFICLRDLEKYAYSK